MLTCTSVQSRSIRSKVAVVEEAYVGREQTQIKHLVLRKYLEEWGIKLAMASAPGRDRLWYVDCFAGPWRTQDEARDDISAAIALEVLNNVRRVAAEHGHNVKVGAVFVELDASRSGDLAEFVEQARGDVSATVFSSALGDCIDDIRRIIGKDSGFVFVDPTGWKGADMKYIAQLAKPGRRDVLVNFMYDFLNRFKAEGQRSLEQRRAWLIEQLEAFFGTQDASRLAKMDEDELVEEYCRNLKSKCNLRFALSLAVPKPLADRTYFHLVVAGNHRKVVELFRDVESSVIGGRAGAIREDARRRVEQERTGQGSLFSNPEARVRSFEQRRVDDLARIEDEIRALLENGERTFGEVWPVVMERLHVRLPETKDAATRLYKSGAIEVVGWKARQRKVKDDNLLRLKQASST